MSTRIIQFVGHGLFLNYQIIAQSLKILNRITMEKFKENC
jgi:hypothetical protein